MIVIDGATYDVDVVSLKRTADFLDKYANRTEDGVLRRKLIGVYFNYQLQFGPAENSKEYQRLWDKLTEPVEYHTVIVPDSSGAYTFKAYFSGVADELMMETAKVNYFRNLTADFIAQAPAKTPGG